MKELAVAPELNFELRWDYSTRLVEVHIADGYVRTSFLITYDTAVQLAGEIERGAALYQKMLTEERRPPGAVLYQKMLTEEPDEPIR